MMPHFDLDKIKFATDPQTFERAVDLYEHGKVTQFKEDAYACSAIVIGTQPYHVSVDARHYDQGHCDCYLGQKDVLCKHMVAVAIRAVTLGDPLSEKEKQRVDEISCSGRVGELTKEQLSHVKTMITSALRHIKGYAGPSRIWFAYQDALCEGCARLSVIVSELPVSKQASDLLVDLLLRLDKKLCTGGVDDSDGTVGRFMGEVVAVLEEYARLDVRCIQSFEKVCKRETCFDWEEPLVRIIDEGLYGKMHHITVSLSPADYQEYEKAHITFLDPSELIAMRDYPPLHSPEAFFAYRQKFLFGDRVEPSVVAPTKIVIEHLKENENRFRAYKDKLEQFLETHPAASYFMLGGKHRSAAATVLGMKIPSLIVYNDADVEEIHRLMKVGVLTGVPSVGKDFEQTLAELDDHYFEHQAFWSMDEKTQAMIDQGDIIP